MGVTENNADAVAERMIYLIGGPTRCGKSHLYRVLRQRFNGDCVQLDPVKVAAKHWNSNILEGPAPDKATYEEWVRGLRDRDRQLWDGMKHWFADVVTRHRSDMLVDGPLWPDFLTEFDVPHRAVFMVDTSPRHVERLLAAARVDNANSWQSDWNDAQIRQWAEYNRLRSMEIKRLADERRYDVVDLADFEDHYGVSFIYPHAQHLAAEKLMPGAGWYLDGSWDPLFFFSDELRASLSMNSPLWDESDVTPPWLPVKGAPNSLISVARTEAVSEL